jgi:hypothetical protein
LLQRAPKHLLIALVALASFLFFTAYFLNQPGWIPPAFSGFLSREPSNLLADLRADRDQPLARTRSIIAGSTASDPKVLKILFYGQSITSPKWTDPAGEYLRRKYPNTRFLIRNMAIGGFSAPLLERTTERDVSDFYPDLIVFHVYGDHRAYERIIRTMRSITTAEIIVETDHLTAPAEPLCQEGFHPTLRAPPGCKGLFWYRQRSWEEHMSGVVLPGLAGKYDLAIEPRRERWAAYIKARGIAPEQLLADPVHPNDAGWKLIASLFEEYFDSAVAGAAPQETGLVSSLPLPAANVPSTYKFSGNRVELISRGPLDGLVTVEIDGHPPDQVAGCWQITRTNDLPGVPGWPAIRKVTVFAEPLRPETWTVTIDHLSSDQTAFDFSVHAKMAGVTEQGRGQEDFYSAAAGTKIEAKDWTMSAALATFKKGVPNGFQVTWSRAFVCHDEPATLLNPGQIEVKHVMVTGLPSGQHLLRLQVSDAVISLIKEVRVYSPPLAQSP